ncbi:MAG TPA: ABC transporter substrate-binding protein, partial [Alphaproteobacteria bacterium]|nr:ABC transporter substrate-binding protein [Alphaproteobacteria bacterium]
MKFVKYGLLAAGALAALAAQQPAKAKDIVIGFLNDRTGPTQTVGVFLGPGYHDYIDLVNSKGGVMGNKLRVIEVDNEYKVPPSIEAYQRFKKEGAVVVGLYGTPITQALTKSLNDDHIPGTSPGFGTAAAANGEKYPYLFPMAASYWSQIAGAVKYVDDQLGGLKGKKIAYLFYDNPAGREPMPVLHALQKKEGFELKEFAVPAPGVEMKVQVQDIARRYHADFVISHLFGKGPSVSIKELKRMG